LDAFEYRKKRFNVLLSDDIFSNFNLILSGEQKPDYIICLDSSTLNDNFKIKHLVKLSKFADCPVFYLNSACRFSDDLQFNGDYAIINEDFELISHNFYREDELIIFDIDNEDGSEVLLSGGEDNKKPVFVRGKNIGVIKKAFGDAGLTLDCGDYDGEELKIFQREIKNCVFVKFSDNPREYAGLKNVKNIHLGDFYNENFYNAQSEENKQILKKIALDSFRTHKT
jgi:hypothetical protein